MMPAHRGVAQTSTSHILISTSLTLNQAPLMPQFLLLQSLGNIMRVFILGQVLTKLASSAMTEMSVPSIPSLDGNTRKKTTLDIAYFFTPKVEDEPHVCISCKWVPIPEYDCNHFTLNGRNTFDALDDKGQWHSQHNYTYSQNTSTSVLRLHLNCFHVEEYAKIAEEHVMQLPSLKGKATEGTMVTSKLKVSFTPDMVTNYLI
jgi:hypothetical protein